MYFDKASSTQRNIKARLDQYDLTNNSNCRFLISTCFNLIIPTTHSPTTLNQVVIISLSSPFEFFLFVVNTFSSWNILSSPTFPFQNLSLSSHLLSRHLPLLVLSLLRSLYFFLFTFVFNSFSKIHFRFSFFYHLSHCSSVRTYFSFPPFISFLFFFPPFFSFLPFFLFTVISFSPSIIFKLKIFVSFSSFSSTSVTFLSFSPHKTVLFSSLIPSQFSPVHWGCWIHWLYLFIDVRLLSTNKGPGMTLSNMMVKLQSWRFGNVESSLIAIGSGSTLNRRGSTW